MSDPKFRDPARRRGAAVRGPTVALALGLTIVGAAIAVVLTQAPPVVLAKNSARPFGRLAVTGGASGAEVCQAGETLPRGTQSIRLTLAAQYGPEVHATVLLGSQIVSAGDRGSGWGANLSLPLQAVSRAISPVTVCLTISKGERVTILGSQADPARAARIGTRRPLAGAFRIEYLGAGRSSWLAMAMTVARHLGLGRAWSGTWVALLVLVSMTTATLLTSLLVRAH